MNGQELESKRRLRRTPAITLSFNSLIEQLVTMVAEQSRAERKAGFKKDFTMHILPAREEETQQLVTHSEGQAAEGQPV